jgi:hypothetical protein
MAYLQPSSITRLLCRAVSSFGATARELLIILISTQSSRQCFHTAEFSYLTASSRFAVSPPVIVVSAITTTIDTIRMLSFET